MELMVCTDHAIKIFYIIFLQLSLMLFLMLLLKMPLMLFLMLYFIMIFVPYLSIINVDMADRLYYMIYIFNFDKIIIFLSKIGQFQLDHLRLSMYYQTKFYYYTCIICHL